VGDAGFQAKCLAKIDEMHRAGRTIVLITHDPGSIQRHCSRCIVIDHCEKVYDGNAQDGAEYYKKLVM
jgi:ABC-type polysaccharide/polyol phosphate transport system ATPase subunit